MRILVVDDDESLRSVVNRGLTEEGYAVDALKTANSANTSRVSTNTISSSSIS